MEGGIIFLKYLFIEDKNDEKFYFGPIWDSGMGFDSDNRIYPIAKKDIFLIMVYLLGLYINA